MATITLPRFQAAAQIVDERGQPTAAFHIWWDAFAGQLEQTFADQQSQITAIAAAQAAADVAQVTANAAQTDATNALAQLTDIASDNKLSPVEKTTVIQDYNVITTEQSDIDAKATTYGVTTEKTNYDNAVSALTTYLATLTTPTLWSDTSGTTDIVGTTFRSKFQDVYTTKQLLLNKLHGTAKTLADTAQTSANSAQTTANTAKRNDAISASFPDNSGSFTILSASDAGSNATITIAAHQRKYGDSTSVSVSGGSVTGLAYNTTYYIYYDDPSQAGGSVTYHATTNADTGAYNVVIGRHYCGSIKTPVSGGSATSGGATPPGGDYCVTVDTLILMADGSQKRAGDLKIGDMVLTRHEDTFEWGTYPVKAVFIVDDQPIVKALLRGQMLEGTPNHRVWVGNWAELSELGVNNGIASIVKITVEDAHTYISNGILSHNVKA